MFSENAYLLRRDTHSVVKLQNLTKKLSILGRKNAYTVLEEVALFCKYCFVIYLFF